MPHNLGMKNATQGLNAQFSRKDMARLFVCAPRTIRRWEEKCDLKPQRYNARVLRYSVGSVIALLAEGKEINREVAQELGLPVQALLQNADQQFAHRLEGNGFPVDDPERARFEVERKLHQLLCDPSTLCVLGLLADRLLGRPASSQQHSAIRFAAEAS